VMEKYVLDTAVYYCVHIKSGQFSLASWGDQNGGNPLTEIEKLRLLNKWNASSEFWKYWM